MGGTLQDMQAEAHEATTAFTGSSGEILWIIGVILIIAYLWYKVK